MKMPQKPENFEFFEEKKEQTHYSLYSTIVLRFFWTILVLVIGGIVFSVPTIQAYGEQFSETSIPGLQIGDFPVGEMTKDDLTEFFSDIDGKILENGISITFEDKKDTRTIVIDPYISYGDQILPLVELDPIAASEYVLNYGKPESRFLLGVQAIRSKLVTPQIRLKQFTIDKQRFSEELVSTVGEFEQEAVNASFRVTNFSPFTYEIVSSSEGVVFNHSSLYKEIEEDVSRLEKPVVTLSAFIDVPDIVESDIEAHMQDIQKILSYGSIDLAFTNPQTKQKKTWRLREQDLANMIAVVKKDDEVALAINPEVFGEYLLEHVAKDVEVEAQDAKFSIGANGKVSQFTGSRPGVAIDVEETAIAFQDALFGRLWHTEGLAKSVTLVTKQSEPTVKTGEVNDLGITEVLGIGYSNFSGSPTNRVKNIRFAVEKKINGTLVKPGDEFSMLRLLEPFTEEAGYLPELVIKGDEITPEVGGGLCQVGSTMFRAAMNAGLDITQRRNHSLVVSYYNDHRNGKPGTDATIYDPAPDFRFRNNTDHYVLITTDMNTKTGDLYFTIWGTSDGRKGYYTEPIVKKWIDAGETKVIPTTNLPVGQRKCQSEHPGASTEFTYVITLPNGEKKERVFESYYRPLPEICLEGVASLPGEGDSTSGAVFDPTADFEVPTTND